MRVPGGGASCLGVGSPETGALPPPTPRPFGRAAGAHYPLAVGVGGAAVGTRHQPHSARSSVLWERHEGARGGASCLGVGRPGSGALPPPTIRAAWARFPLAVGAVCGRGGKAVLGTLSLAAVRRVLCALPGFAAPRGRCGLAPVLVPWLWPAACLSVVPRGPTLVCRSSSGPVALGAPVGFSVAAVPSPTPGAVAPGFTWWLRGARAGRLRTGLIVPAAGPCRGKGAGRTLRRTRSGPRDGVVPGGFLRLWSRASCAAVVWRVWTRSLTGLVSRTNCLATGDSACAPGLFRVDADTPPFGSEDATPGSRACVRVRPPGRVLVRLTFPLAVLGSPFACSAPSGLGLPRLWLLFGFFLFYFFFFFSFPLSLRPRCVLLCVFSGPGCLGPWRLVAPPFFFAPPPCCLWRFLLSGCLGPLRPPPPFFFLCFLFFLFPFFFFFFAGCVVRGGFVCLRPSGVPACASVVLSLSLLCVRGLVLRGVCCWAWLSSAVSWWVLVSCFGGAVLAWPRGSPPCGSAWCVLVFRCPVLCSVTLCCCVVVCCRALLFVCVVACAFCLFLAAARLLCVFWGVVLCVPCPLRPVRCCAAMCWCRFVVLCASSVLFLVAGVVGSWCRCLLLGVCWWLWLPGIVVRWCVSALVPLSGLAVARCLPCGVLLPCAESCGAVLPCRAVLWCPVFFFCFSPCWWRWFPVVPCWFSAPGRFQVVSVSLLCPCGAVLVCLRLCSLFGALLPARGWLVFCAVACCVCVFAVGPGCPLLSPGGSWRLLVSCLGGVLWCVPGCCAAPCCCALCCLALRCCALCCFLLLCLVLPRAVLCPGALSVVLGPCAFWRRVLSCPPALCVFCCGLSLRGVVRRYALCRVCPGVSCCVFPVVSALCGVAVWPALPRCPAPLCCALWCCAAPWCPWCPVLPPCWVCFLRGCGCTYLKKCCKIS